MKLLKRHSLIWTLLLLLCLVIGWSIYSISVNRDDRAVGANASTSVQKLGIDRPAPKGDATSGASETTPGQGTAGPGMSTPPDASGGVRLNPPPGGAAEDRVGPGGDFSDRRGGGQASTASSVDASSAPLALYAALFFGAAAALLLAAGWLRRTGGWLRTASPQRVLWLTLGIGFFARLALAPAVGGHPFDLNLFRQWASAAAEGLTSFYTASGSDYPPLYIYVLYGIGKLIGSAALSPYAILFLKLPSILADIATAYLLYRIAKPRLRTEIGLGIAAFYMFNPAVFINSTFWGQVDSFFTLLVVLGVYFISQNKLGWASMLMTAAVLMKPQGMIFLPVLGFALLSSRSMKLWLKAAVSAIATAVVVILPFAWGKEPLWIVKLYASTIGEYPYASVNAFNFFSFLGANYKSDQSTLLLLSYSTWGMIFIVLITLFSGWLYLRSKNLRWAAAIALVQIAGVFTFASSMHERYLFPAAALALLAYIELKDRRILWIALGFSATIFMNTYDIFYHHTSGGESFYLTLAITSLLNVLLCAYLGKVLWNAQDWRSPSHCCKLN